MIPRLKTAVLIVLSSLMIVSANTNASFSFDIDGDGNKDALTDGLLVLRHLFGFSGSTLSEGAVATDATRSEATDLESHLETNAQYLDIDGDGQNDALTDGLLLLRLLFGFEGDTLVQGAVSADATRTTASSIEAYIDSPLTYFAPSISGLPSAISVAENQTAVATVSAIDPDGDPLTYSLTGTDVADFTISSAGVITFNTAPDFETKSSYSITVTVSDGTNASSQSVTITVTNANDAPVIAGLGLSVSVSENQTAVTTVSATDADGDTVTYSLTGSDAADFSISSAGVITFNTAPDYETKSSYAVTVNAGDGTSTTSQSFTILVDDETGESLQYRAYKVTPISGLTIEGSIPNVSLVKNSDDENIVLLVYSSPSGICEAKSDDGLTFTGTGVRSEDLANVLAPLPIWHTPTGVLVRQLASGDWRYFIKGLGGPDNLNRHIYVADRGTGGVLELRNNNESVYSGGQNDNNRVEVFDVVEATDEKWVMYYVSPTGTPTSNSRSAISSDRGMSWTFHSDNPFSDRGVTRAQDRNVDPAVLRLQDDTFMAVTMRAQKLYFWNSADGYEWAELPGSELSSTKWNSDEVGDAVGLYDPTLLQLSDGTIYLYSTAGGGSNDDVVVAATVTY